MSQELDFIGALVGFLLTILIFTYILGDNAIFRVVTSIFIGVSAGFAVVIVFYNVLWHSVLQLIYNPVGALPRIVPPFILGLLLFLKLSPRFSRLANPVMAFVVGAAAATAIGGAVLGTIFPQAGAASGAFDLVAFRATLPQGENIIADSTVAIIRGLFALVATVTTLAFFHFGARPAPDQPSRRLAIIEQLAKVGQFFLAVTLGTLFAGVYAAALAALLERLSFIINFFRPFIPS